MQPLRQPFQLVDQDMPEANMGMSEQMPHFPQLGHHMPHSGLVLPAPRAVLPGGYMPNMGAPMQPPFYTVCISLFYFDVCIWKASPSQ